MQNAKRVILNTGILYAKMLVTIGISLYSTRLVLSALGVSDYGTYNLIAGIIIMLSFINVAMTTSTQRYFSFYQGTKDTKMQKDIFRNSLLLHLAIGVILIIILLLVSLFLFDDFLNIPEERIFAAKAVYYFMLFSVLATVLSVPFTATLNAHENMLWIAIGNTIEVMLKLGVAFSLYIYDGDKLIFYGLSIAIISIMSLLFYSFFCMKKYSECTLNLHKAVNPKLMKELASFAGWNLFGALCGVGRTQGLAIILNLFFGTVVNAAYGLANQVSGQMNFFSVTMLRALNPQIMKSEGAGDRQRMLRLSMMASKFGFFLLAFVAIPCIFEMPSILHSWLKEIPEYTISFCILILVAIMTNQLTIGLQSAIQATGRIKIYQSIVGIILLLNLPISYFLLKQDFPIYSVMISFIMIELIACGFRILFLKKIVGLSVKEYINRVLLMELVPVLASTSVCLLITNVLCFDFRFIFTFIVSIIVFVICIYFWGLCKDEKAIVNDMAKKGLAKLRVKS
jgi:Na+-driven multidrug efflux pump